MMTNAKRITFIVLAVLGIGAIIGSLLYIMPKSYSLRLEGLEYQLGEANKNNVKSIVLVVDGRLKRSLFGDPTFTGMVYVEGEQLPIPKDKKVLTLKFDDGYALMTYRYGENRLPAHYSYGSIFANRDFSVFTINKYARETPDSNHAGWNSGDGMMITAPAATRQEAIEISNELMRNMMRDANPLE